MFYLCSIQQGASIMTQADFAYNTPANDSGAVPLAISVFVERAHLRDELCGDAVAAGFRIAELGSLADLIEGEARPLGEVVILDCAMLDPAGYAALARLDLRAKQAGSHLIVFASTETLDAVFGCLEQSQPQILIDPTRADRVIALGRALARLPNLRLRELSDDDRLLLLRVTEQIGQIGERLERLESPLRQLYEGEARAPETEAGVFRFESPRRGYDVDPDESGDRLVRAARPALPDPRLIRRIIRQRQLRARFFDGELFADPAWDMLLDLTAARAEHAMVSITSLCIASCVPPTTALRWIGQMCDAGLFARVNDEADRRRAFIVLTDKAADGMARYFAEMGKAAARMV
jgi:hypothetical protein